MHDGGGNRSETLAALPRVIDTLRSRGYSLRDGQRQLLGYKICSTSPTAERRESTPRRQPIGRVAT